MTSGLRWTREEWDDWAKRRLERKEEPRKSAPQRLPKTYFKTAALYPLVLLAEAAGLPAPTPEYRFHDARLWRFDYAWPLHKVAVEVDGGVWIAGRHNRGQGFIEDQRKLNEAAALGWRVIRVTPERLAEAIELVGRIMRGGARP